MHSFPTLALLAALALPLGAASEETAEHLYDNTPGLTQVERDYLHRCAHALAANPCVALCMPESIELRWHPHAKRG